MTMKVEGLKELDKALAELPKATARNVLVRALKKAAEPMRAAAAAKAPVLTGKLRDSVVFTTKKPKYHDMGSVAYYFAMRGGASKDEAAAAMRGARQQYPNAFAEVFMGPTRRKVGYWQEFGTVNMSPNPFMRPAWDAHKRKTVDVFSAILEAEIDKSAKRLAKKRAKAAGAG